MGIPSITLLWGGTIESDFFRDFVVIAVVYELYRIKSRDEAEADAFFDSAGMGKRDVDGFEGEQVGATFETGVELEYDHGTGGTGEVIPMDTYMDEDEDDSSSPFATMGGSVDPMLGPSTGAPSNPVFSGDVYGDPYSVPPSLSTPPPPPPPAMDLSPLSSMNDLPPPPDSMFDVVAPPPPPPVAPKPVVPV